MSFAIVRASVSSLLALAIACGSTSGDRPVGTGGSGGRPPLELTLRTPERVTLDLSDLRGRRVLVFFFATFDGMSQASLSPLAELVRAHPEVYVIGVAQQPDPELLLDAYVNALDPPFVVGFDPSGALARGTSDFGTVDMVPTFVVLDEDGREVARHEGYARVQRLEEMLAR
jgi:hypothetical protein